MDPEFRPLSAPVPTAWRSLGDLPDDSLVERARQQDLAAFEALMRRHNRRLFRVTRGVLRDSDAAQDAVQETYLRAFTRLDTYQPEGKFGAWLSRIASWRIPVQFERVSRPSAQRVTISRPPCSRAAWSINVGSRNSQSCISPSIGLSPEPCYATSLR